MNEPSAQTKTVAGKVIDLLQKRTANWTEASEAIQLALAYMFAGIEDSGERVTRLALLANGAMALSERLRHEMDKVEKPKPETLQ